MILVVDDQRAAGCKVAARFEQLGVTAVPISATQLGEWLDAMGPQEVQAIEAIVVGYGPEMAPLIKRVRQRTIAPLLAVADPVHLDDRLRALAAGADDVVGSAMHTCEILGRIAAIARRSRAPSAPVFAADIVVHPDGRDPIVANQPLDLPRRERRILEHLARHHGIWQSKTQIFNHIYGVFNEALDETVIESHVCRLRKRLAGRLGYNPIKSQRHLGYRLVDRPGPPSSDDRASPGQRTVVGEPRASAR